MAQIEIGALDPIAAFTGTLQNLVEITDVFKSSDSIPAIDYLRATSQAKEILGAITFVVMASQMAMVSDRLTPEVRAEFDAEQTARELAKDTSMDGTMQSIRRLLEPWSQHLEVDTDDLPPGFGFPGADDV